MHTFSYYTFRDQELFVCTQFCALVKEICGHIHMCLYILTTLYKYTIYYRYWVHKSVGYNCDSGFGGEVIIADRKFFSPYSIGSDKHPLSITHWYEMIKRSQLWTWLVCEEL